MASGLRLLVPERVSVSGHGQLLDCRGSCNACQWLSAGVAVFTSPGTDRPSQNGRPIRRRLGPRRGRSAADGVGLLRTRARRRRSFFTAICCIGPTPIRATLPRWSLICCYNTRHNDPVYYRRDGTRIIILWKSGRTTRFASTCGRPVMQICLLGAGFNAAFYARTLHRHRSRDRVAVVYSRTDRVSPAFCRAMGSSISHDRLAASRATSIHRRGDRFATKLLACARRPGRGGGG